MACEWRGNLPVLIAPWILQMGAPESQLIPLFGAHCFLRLGIMDASGLVRQQSCDALLGSVCRFSRELVPFI